MQDQLPDMKRLLGEPTAQLTFALWLCHLLGVAYRLRSLGESATFPYPVRIGIFFYLVSEIS